MLRHAQRAGTLLTAEGVARAEWVRELMLQSVAGARATAADPTLAPELHPLPGNPERDTAAFLALRAFSGGGQSASEHAAWVSRTVKALDTVVVDGWSAVGDSDAAMLERTLLEFLQDAAAHGVPWSRGAPPDC